LAATAKAAGMEEARAMAAVKVMRTSDSDDDDATREGGGERTTQLPSGQRRRGDVLPTSPDGQCGARLCPATTGPRRRDNKDGR